MTEEEKGASLFGRSIDLVEGDPLEEIFALNLGDFISENLISKDLAAKIGNSEKNKTSRLKNQLSELVSVYSMNNTLSVIGFNSKDDYIIYNAFRSWNELGIKTAICFTENGYTATRFSSLAPRIPVITFTQSKETYRYLSLVWWVKGYKISQSFNYENLKKIFSTL